jgi:DNA (cytosine-5)-methyltransferase 1
MKLVHGSLFSGFDAPSVAASWMGWENAFHCEINPFCNEILKYWFPDSEHYEDITKTDFSQWKGRIDVLTGGFPCQPFSLAGQRKGADDNRYLWPHMLRAIREIRPDWVIGENVAGILTMVQPGKETEVGSQTSLFGEDNRKRILLRQEYVVETICKDLEREGYSVQPLLIPACAVGAPHRRDRVWFIAHCADSRTEEVRRERKDKVLSDGIAPDTYCEFQSQRMLQGEKGRYKQKIRTESLHSRSNWQNFPTQSPVCRGNDGLPFDVDNLTIPFTKWRQESVKGYGNAIVPQVILEIFKAIEELDN